MSNSDTWIPKMGDIPAAIGLLSRLPMPVDMHKAQARGAHPSWAYGLAGGLLGALVALAAWAGLILGLPTASVWSARRHGSPVQCIMTVWPIVWTGFGAAGAHSSAST